MNKRISRKALRKLVLKEFYSLQEAELSGELQDIEKVAKEVPETDASEMADALEQNIDFMKALKIQEKKLIKSLKKIREVKSKLRSKLINGIDKG